MSSLENFKFSDFTRHVDAISLEGFIYGNLLIYLIWDKQNIRFLSDYPQQVFKVSPHYYHSFLYSLNLDMF